MNLADLLLILGPLVLTGGALAWTRFQDNRRTEWVRLRHDHGLAESRDDQGPMLIAHHGAATLRIRGRDTETWTVEVEGLPPGLSARMAESRPGAGTPLGVPWFDGEVALGGPQALWRAVLDRRARGALVRLVDSGAVLGAGRVRWSVPRAGGRAKLRRWLKALEVLALRMDIDDKIVPDLLAQRVRLDDPDAGVPALWALADHWPDHPALQRLLDQPYTAPGQSVYLPLLALIRGGVPQAQLQTWVRGPRALPSLRLRALAALDVVVGEDAEALLVSTERSVLLAALGRVRSHGTAGCVPPLQDRLGRTRRDPELRRALEGAVTTIQARVDPRLQGTLTVVEDGAGGELSVARDQGQGELSLVGRDEPSSG